MKVALQGPEAVVVEDRGVLCQTAGFVIRRRGCVN